MKLLSIEDYPKQEMWDIEVQNSHCFFANGVLVHNSNGAFRYDNVITAQSRERDLSLTSDNAGFFMFTNQNYEFLEPILKGVKGENDVAVIYGEWSGGNIQAGVAINGLPKMFIIFGIRLINGLDETWIDGFNIEPIITKYTTIQALNEKNIYVITQFPTYEIDIDFNKPEEAQNKLVELTIAVEEECPVGKYFGKSGIGEGIVISHISPEYGYLTAKCKGERHSNSKVKTLAPIDEEAFAKAEDFAENYTTQARLEQGIHVMKAEMQLDAVTENVGTFIKWVVQDVMKEEQQGIVDNNIDPKKVVKKIGDIARKWYFQQCN